MARILSISSQVVAGHVGNSAITFALQRAGHNVLAVPTILLSNHPGHKKFAGSPLDLTLLDNIFDTLISNGEFENLDAIITGYLPTPEHAELVVTIIKKAKSQSPNIKILIDPVLGDYPKGLYIKPEVADIIRSKLISYANITTPNWFELKWLSKKDTDIITAARSLPAKAVLVTSAPGPTEEKISNILITETECWSCTTKKRDKAPNGTGDLFAALFLGNLLNAKSNKTALANATSALDTVLKASWDKPELQLIPTQQNWMNPKSLPTQKLEN